MRTRRPRSLVALGATSDLGELSRLAVALLRERGATDAQAQAGASIGRFESFYGTRKPFLLPDGSPSWNFGGTTARKDVPWFGGGDLDSSGKPISQRWARWPDMAAGIDYWLTFGSVRAALPFFAEGNAVAGAAQMFDRGYYTATKGTREERIMEYTRAIVETAKQVAAATGMPLLLRGNDPIPPKATGAPPSAPSKRTREGSELLGIVATVAVPVLGILAVRKFMP